MKSYRSASVRWSSVVLAIAIAVLLARFEFFGVSISQAFPTKRGRVEGVIVTHGTTYFVAVSGSDNGPGTADRPWATINHAAEKAEAGDTVVVRSGRYILPAQVRPRNSGRPNAWITFNGITGEEPILDAQMVQRPPSAPVGLNNGAFQIEGVSYVRVAHLALINSHDAGFTIRDSSNIDLINNSTNGTFSSGIGVWDSNHGGSATQHIRIIGNTITRATTWEFAPSDMPRQGWPPQEALSIAGAIDFEVAYNHVYSSDKEGIDIKETSKHGHVHHNSVHNMGMLGIYVDAWFGELSDVDIFSNVIHDCRSAGLALSVENGESVKDVRIHNNLIFSNDGSGLYFSRWGVNHVRRNIQVFHNVFYHNGYGPPKADQTYYWNTGGLYLYSTSVYGVSITNNIFSDNRGFQIGYSDLYLRNSESWQTAAREHEIQISANLINGRNTVDIPIKSGGDPPDRVDIFGVNGDHAIFGNPLFKDTAGQDFSLRRGSPAVTGHIVAGAYAPGSLSELWWKRDFPPTLGSVPR